MNAKMGVHRFRLRTLILAAMAAVLVLIGMALYPSFARVDREAVRRNVEQAVAINYSVVNLEGGDPGCPRPPHLALPPELAPGERPDITAFFMPIVHEYPELEREIMAVVDEGFLLAFNRFQRDLVKAVDARSVTDLESLFDPSALPDLRDASGRSTLFSMPYLACPLAPAPDEVPAVLLRPLFPEEKPLLGKTAPSGTNQLERLFMCGVLTRLDGPQTLFPIVWRDGSFFIILSMRHWLYQPEEISELGERRNIAVLPRLSPAYGSDGAESLGRSLLDALRTGAGSDALPVLEAVGASQLRDELRCDAALLSAAFGPRLTRIRFRPALGWNEDFESIRMATRAGSGRLPPNAPEPESPLAEAGVWLVAEAVVDADGLEWPVATWHALETEDGVCRLASSAFSCADIPSQEAIQALRDAEEEMSRVLASNPCVRLLAEAARGLPAGPAGPPLLGFFSRMEAGE